jgi:septal ring factor EnvC (AmiA/AmiB activator)
LQEGFKERAVAAAVLGEQFNELQAQHAQLQAEHTALRDAAARHNRHAERAGERALSEAPVVSPSRTPTPTGASACPWC